MTISDRNIVSKPPVIIDPNFFLPPGVVDARYINDEDTKGLYELGSDQYETAGDGDTTPVEVPVIEENAVVQAPTEMKIIDQVVSVAPDGRFVVDVVIEVADIPGVANYEVRLTKV